MINQLVEEVQKALDNDLYLVALNTALTLPDICGKAEFPDLKTTQRYIDWFDEHIGQYEDDKSNDNMPKLTGKVIYSLRCSLLHQGNPNIDNKITTIDKFILEKRKTLDIDGVKLDLYIDTSSISTYPNGETVKKYNINIRGICFKICRVAQNYYNENKEKFNFFNYEIRDVDEDLKKHEDMFKCLQYYIDNGLIK